MSQTFSWFKLPLVPKTLTTDTRLPLFHSGQDDTLAEARRMVIVYKIARTAASRLQTLHDPVAGL